MCLFTHADSLFFPLHSFTLALLCALAASSLSIAIADNVKSYAKQLSLSCLKHTSAKWTPKYNKL
uniref:Uncharacterized protein n=1 Tax=Moniliophthora roreri TaxID=221103 RepID=A0A0W0EUW0_MONRR